MASQHLLEELPEYIRSAWRLDGDADARAECDPNLFQRWSPASLAERLFIFQLDAHQAIDESSSPSIPEYPSRAIESVVERIIDPSNLAESMESFNPAIIPRILQQILRDPRLPYQLLRHFLKLSQTWRREDRLSVDIDQAILENERYLRKARYHGGYLVTLRELLVSVANISSTSLHHHTVTIQRNDPSEGGLETLDTLRPTELQIHADAASFCEAFQRIIGNALGGVSWDNMLVAGGMVLTTLLHLDAGLDGEVPQNSDIDIYLYGLDAERANLKVEEIYVAWCRSLSNVATGRLVVKTAKTIELLTEYLNRRLQIVLKLSSTSLDVLLNFDLDACAMAFNGSDVLMLPRCARALETGYNAFIMNLIWGHHLDARRESRIQRVLKYADRGFGIRFLPSYGRSLEDITLETSVRSISENLRSSLLNDPILASSDECGAEALKRVFDVGKEFVRQLCLGANVVVSTRAGFPPQQMDQVYRYNAFVYGSGDNTRDVKLPILPLWVLLYRGADSKLCPVRSRALRDLEMFARVCEAWRLSQTGDAYLDTVSVFRETGPEQDSVYGQLPIYVWDRNFDLTQVASRIDQINERLINESISSIRARRRRPEHHDMLDEHLPLSIRSQVCGPDMSSVQSTVLAFPVLASGALEERLRNILRDDRDISACARDLKRFLAPMVRSDADFVSDFASSSDMVSQEEPVLRLWVIDSLTMWAGQHRALDEVAELMWPSIKWFRTELAHPNAAPHSGAMQFAQAYRSRIILPDISANTDQSERRNQISLRESLLFRAWVHGARRTRGH